MTVLDEMLQIRDSLMRKDQQHAMQMLTAKLYYEASSYVKAGENFTLFPSKAVVVEFCKNNNVDVRAMEWLLDAMREECLIESREMPIILTPHAVETLCL